MTYTIKKLAESAGISVRTLHYYDELGLLKPESRGSNGYRQYGEKAAVCLQQIMFFRELGFSLDEIKKIISQPDFDVLQALQSHRILLSKRLERFNELLDTVDRTIGKIKRGEIMDIKEYYQGFSEEQIEKYRDEVRRRWGEKTLIDSEDRVKKMGKEKFAALQAEGGKIFQTISDNMGSGYDSSIVQKQVAKWRQWLENFHHYSDEAVLGLGEAYSQHPEFSKFFEKYHKDLPGFLTMAIEHYCRNKNT
jgi:MerR family transcriptional regulator, thiopeptide resistance regulator